jgi:cytochrome c-type biogenesis protein CcmE
MLKDSSPIGRRPRQPGQWRFITGGLLIVAAIIYLVVTSTQANAQYFLTIEELQNQKSSMQNQAVRISGAVIGSSIRIDEENMQIRFTLVNIPGDQKEIDRMGGIVEVLHQAVNDNSLPRLEVIYSGVKPDLLKNEAQAIITGVLDEDGLFRADELLLKCPTRYAEALPDQSE